MMTIKCSKCGNELNENDQVCLNCGAPNESLQSNTEEVRAIPEEVVPSVTVAAPEEIVASEAVVAPEMVTSQEFILGTSYESNEQLQQEYTGEQNNQVEGYNNYQEAKQLMNKPKRKLPWILGGAVAFILIAVVAVFLLTGNMRTYNKAEELLAAGQYIEASELYEKVPGYKDADVKYNYSLYTHGENLAEEYLYEEAFEYFTKIDYQDSQELAEKYEKYGTTRFIDERFYYQPDEFIMLLDNILKEFDKRYSAKLNIQTESDVLIDIYNNKGETDISLILKGYDRENESFTSINVLDRDFGKVDGLQKALSVGIIGLSNATLSLKDCQSVLNDLVDNMQTEKDDISYLLGYIDGQYALQIMSSNSPELTSIDKTVGGFIERYNNNVSILNKDSSTKMIKMKINNKGVAELDNGNAIFINSDSVAKMDSILESVTFMCLFTKSGLDDMASSQIACYMDAMNIQYTDAESEAIFKYMLGVGEKPKIDGLSFENNSTDGLLIFTITIE